jgi:hypothetical protein
MIGRKICTRLLRGVVTELAAEAGPGLGLEIQPSFGGSGSMRERQLETQGRTTVPGPAETPR